MAILFNKGINVDFSKGAFISLEKKEYNLSTFFNPIDIVYGQFDPKRNWVSNKEKIGPDKEFRSIDDFKQQWYLREGLFNGEIPNLAIEPYKSKIENHKVINIAFEIIEDLGSSIQKYHLKIYYLEENDNLETLKSSNPILIMPKQTIMNNENYEKGELFLRLGNYCKPTDVNRFVIFFHGRNESNCPGRIPSE